MEDDDEDDSFLIDANTSGGGFSQAYKDALGRGLEQEKQKLHQTYDEVVVLEAEIKFLR
jgi:hypothetical protein